MSRFFQRSIDFIKQSQSTSGVYIGCDDLPGCVERLPLAAGDVNQPREAYPGGGLVIPGRSIYHSLGSADGWFSINSFTHSYLVLLIAKVLRTKHQDDGVKRLEVS